MPLVADGWDTIWEDHWPLNQCTGAPHGLHELQHTGAITQCATCYKWFGNTNDELAAYLAAAGGDGAHPWGQAPAELSRVPCTNAFQSTGRASP